MEMTFGKYKGYDIKEIPYEYLVWVRTNVDIKYRKLKQEIEWRILEIEAYWQECEDMCREEYDHVYGIYS